MDILERTGRYAEAHALASELLPLSDSLPEDDRQYLLYNLALIESRLSNHVRAEEIFRDLLARSEATDAPRTSSSTTPTGSAKR